MIVVEGAVTEAYDMQPVGSVEVEIAKSVISNGAFSSGFEVISTDETNEAGEFSVEFEPQSVIEYRIRTRKDGFYFKEEFVDREVWLPKEENVYDIQINQASTLSVQIDATSASGRVLFKLDPHSEGCIDCCKTATNYVVNAGSDTMFSCNVYGNQIIGYQLFEASSDGDSLTGQIEVKQGENTFYHKIQ